MSVKNFFSESERRKAWFDCLVEVENFLDACSDDIKRHKMNNIKGFKHFLQEFRLSLDKFVETGGANFEMPI